MTTGSDAAAPLSLTPVQVASLPVWRAYWQRMLCNTAPAARAATEEALRRVHRAWGTPIPEFVWVSSLQGVGLDALARESRSLMYMVMPHIRNETEQWASLTGSPAWRRVLAAVGPTAAGPRRWAPLPPLAALEILSAYGFFRVVIGLPLTDRAAQFMDPWLLAVRACGWFWKQYGVCWLCDRPSAIHLDADGRLHHPSQAAVRFRDGFERYYWHGTEVPPSWITNPEQLDPWVVLNWRHAAQRAAGADMVGWHRILDVLDPITVDKHDDPEIGELVEVQLPAEGSSRLLKVRCGTGRTFVLRVPPFVQSALEANAWTYRMRPYEYRPEVRT
jgi:hypothetical protein